MTVLPNLLTVDSDRANFPLHGGMQDFLVQSNEPKGAEKAPCSMMEEIRIGQCKYTPLTIVG